MLNILCFWQCRRYEVITTPTDIIMVIEYAGGELFNYIVEKGKVCANNSRGIWRLFTSVILLRCTNRKLAGSSNRSSARWSTVIDTELSIET
jgi:hypothetical protein